MPDAPRRRAARGQVGALREEILLAAVCESVFDAIAVRMQAAGESVAEPFAALRLWAAAHGVAAMLISKPDFPWPAGFVADTITMAGLGLVLESRLGELPDLAEQLSRAR